MNFMVSASTDIGTVKKTNQDSYGVKVISINGENIAFAVLCDGMGGLIKGEVASASVVKAFERWMLQRLPMLYGNGLTSEIIRAEWSSILTEYNEKIKCYGRRCGTNLGTTAVAILLAGGAYYIVNVGDSRIYEIQKSITVMTSDQTVVAREVALGQLSPEAVETDPRRSVLLQCVGASDIVYPDFYTGSAKVNAVYMLCSDGFRHEVTEKEIYEEMHPAKLVNVPAMQNAEKTLIDWNKNRQEWDNISVVTIRTY